MHARHLYTLLIDPEVSGMTRDQFMLSLHERAPASTTDPCTFIATPLLKDEEVERIGQAVREVLLRRTL